MARTAPFCWRSHEHGLASEPGNAQLHFWLGKSCERTAEMASPLFARRDARKAQFHLEAAVRPGPGNREFLRELFEFMWTLPNGSTPPQMRARRASVNSTPTQAGSAGRAGKGSSARSEIVESVFLSWRKQK